MSDAVVYNDSELELKVSVENETVWLNRNQIAELFDRDVKTIGKHVNNVFSDGELERFSVVANFATTASDGKVYDVEYYNLDVIISVGYRVKSQKGVKFRQWATSVLKGYITSGYAINTHKITEQRLLNLENDVNYIKSQIRNSTLEIKQGIFYDGQTYDAYVFINELIKSAKNNIILFDNYIDETVLTMLSKNQSVDITLYVKTISKQLELDIKKYNSQYKSIAIKEFALSHDRFLLIDNDVYHIGASLKDLGKKWFAFSKMSKSSLEIVGKIEL